MIPALSKANDCSTNLKSIIAKTSLFRMLDEKQLDDIVSSTRSIQAKAHTPIVSHGDAANGAFWIVYGQVKIVLHTKQGTEKILEILGQNTCFGLGEMLLGRPHIALVKTTTEAMLLHVDRTAIMRVAAQNFDFSRELMTCVGRQFYSLVRDIEAYSQSAKQRLAEYLLRQSRREISADIELVAKKSLIASRLSLTPETLSRLFHDLSAEGLIAISGRRIKILDFERMSAVMP
ncbi:MAG: Crp/Fnr family transcriptional regulator [Glaciimonas sp.]|nr:Crp/Fnr family transcriptional regulator [Glaciimonas sp.]